MLMSRFKFDIIDVIDQPDGSAKIILQFDVKTKESIKQTFGWKRWNTKKFEQLFKQAIQNYVDSQQQNEGTEID